MKIEDLDKPFNMKQKCSCGGDYWSVNYLGFNAPNAKCQTCGKETTLCPEHNLIILKQGDEKMKADFKVRLLPETNQVLLSAKDYKNYVWMVKQIKEVHKR